MALRFGRAKVVNLEINSSLPFNEVILIMKLKLLAALTFLGLQVPAQSRLAGIWEGKLAVGSGLTIQFIIHDSAGMLKGTMDSPDQGAYDISVDSLATNKDSICLFVKSAGITCRGKFINDTLIECSFRQGIKLPLTLHKIPRQKNRLKPQTPMPPFDYNEEEVSFSSKSGDILFSGTLTFPRAGNKSANQKFPAILLITGSGLQNRDEEILGHKPFRVIADHLTKNGFAVLRVDDRGVGKSTGDMSLATSEDLADDAEAALDYLKSKPYVNTMKTGLAGHSEGALIAGLLASRRKDIDFIILLAGPGVKGSELMAEQNRALLTAGGIPSDAVEKYIGLYRMMVRDMVSAPDSAAAYERGKADLEKWLSQTDSQTVKKLGLAGKARQSVFLKAFTSEMRTPWMRYFLQAEPADALGKIRCKVLALNGEKDVQVVSKPNLDGIRSTLEKNNQAGTFEVKELPGLNHLFQQCEKCTPGEYGRLDETFSKDALDIMLNWLKKHVISEK